MQGELGLNCEYAWAMLLESSCSPADDRSCVLKLCISISLLFEWSWDLLVLFLSLKIEFYDRTIHWQMQRLRFAWGLVKTGSTQIWTEICSSRMEKWNGHTSPWTLEFIRSVRANYVGFQGKTFVCRSAMRTLNSWTQLQADCPALRMFSWSCSRS